MSRKLPNTPRSRIRSALRNVFLRSRERAAVLKEASYTCSCGAKQSKAKGREVSVQVHHRTGIDNWDAMIDAVYTNLLNKDDMEVLCRDCHKSHHDKEET